jgi:hypothetical protein
MISVLGATLDIGGLFDPPYPSELTPLSWDEGSVVWTASETIIFHENSMMVATGDNEPSDLYEEYGGWGRNWSDMHFFFGYSTGSWDIGYPGISLNDQSELSLGFEATITIPAGGWVLDGQEIEFNLAFTDFQGNGYFDKCDLVALEASPNIGTTVFRDYIYTLALAYICPTYRYVPEFSFTFHDGEFYSWESDTLNSDQPWWE